MTRKLFAAGILLTALVTGLHACSDEVTAPTVTEVHAHGQGNFTVTPISGQKFRLETTVTGVLSPIGPFTAKWVVPEAVLENGQVRVLDKTWTGELITDNGKILGEYTWRDQVLPIREDGVIELVADLVVTGGTGRYVGVGGEAVTTGTADLSSRMVLGEVEGHLTNLPDR